MRMFCEKCGLPEITCMCDRIPKREVDIEFWVLTHERELRRKTNTGKLLRAMFHNTTHIYVWDRQNPPSDLLSKLESDAYDVYLLFPSDDEEVNVAIDAHTHKKKAFILIDATWQEARKIVRKSPYLSKLKRLTLQPEGKSQFSLRRNQLEGSLCTVECGVQLLDMVGEEKLATELKDVFKDFIEHYNAGMHDHVVKKIKND